MTESQMPSRISMPCPFAAGTNAALTAIDSTEGNTVNFKQGFPAIYGLPASNGGKYVGRGEMNAIGNLASNDLFYHKAGGLNTFDPEFCTAIGGYPKGAVLQYLVNNQLFDVVSMEDNNTTDFTTVGVDGIKWRYCNKDYGTIENETIIGSYSGTNINLITDIARNCVVFRIPHNGIVYIRNLKYDHSSGGSVAASECKFCGSGLVAKTFTSGEISSYTECAAENSTRDGWSAITVLNSGVYYTGSGSSSNGFLSVKSVVDDNVRYILWNERFTFPGSLLSVSANNFIAISLINGFNYLPYNSNTPPTSMCTYDIITNLSFDVVIVR